MGQEKTIFIFFRYGSGLGVCMKQGTIMERSYSITNMERYQDLNFLEELDRITSDEGVTILERTIDKGNSSVRIKARFDSNNWDVCKALEFLSINKISVSPISDFKIIIEKDLDIDEMRISVVECKKIIKELKKSEKELTVS